jgi:hypothetical protein
MYQTFCFCHVSRVLKIDGQEPKSQLCADKLETRFSGVKLFEAKKESSGFMHVMPSSKKERSL